MVHLSYYQDEMLMIDHFVDIRRKQGDTELLVTWRGFPADKSDWATLSLLREDVPILVEEYLSDVSINGTKKQRYIARSV